MGQSAAKIWNIKFKLGPTTIENIINKKYIDEEVSRVHFI